MAIEDTLNNRLKEVLGKKVSELSKEVILNSKLRIATIRTCQKFRSEKQIKTLNQRITITLDSLFKLVRKHPLSITN